MLFNIGNVILCVLICNGIMIFYKLKINGIVMKIIMIILCVLKILL